MKHAILSISFLFILLSSTAQDTLISQPNIGANWYSGNNLTGGQSFTLNNAVSISTIRFFTNDPEGVTVFQIRENQDINGTLLFSDTIDIVSGGWISVSIPSVEVCPGIYCFTLSEFNWGAIDFNNTYSGGNCLYGGWIDADMTFQVIGEESTIAPVPVADTLLPFTAMCSIVQYDDAPEASDCSTITGVPDQPLADLEIGTHTITWTFTDPEGNSVSQLQQFNIVPLESTASIDEYVLTAEVENADYQWIDCNNGNAVISGETGQSMTITEATGNYAVITTLNSCSDTSECIAFDFVSLNETEAVSFTVYPNPNNGFFHISMENGVTASFRILDMSGRIIREGKVNDGELTVENMLSGIYFIEITSESKSIGTRRIIVN